MKIWILNQHAVPARGSGGSRHAILGKHLQRRGHDVTVFAGDDGRGGREGAGPERRWTGARLYVEDISDNVRWRSVRVRRYRNTVERVLSMLSYRKHVPQCVGGLSAPDIIIGSCVHPYAVEAAMNLARRFGARFVYEIRDIWPESLVDVGALSCWNPVYWQFRRLAIRAFRHADGVIGVSPGMREYAAAHGISDEKFLYLPNGIDAELYGDVSMPPERDLFNFAYLGSQGRVNGLTTLLEAVSILRNMRPTTRCRILIIGDGPENGRLQEMAKSLRLTNVEFVPRIPKAEVPRACHLSDAFIYCHSYMPVVARYGVSANKLFDYLAAARPVIFSCTSRNNPVRESGAGLSVPANDPAALANAMLQVSETPVQERWRMGLRGRAYVLAHHSLALLAQRLEEFLEQLLKDGPVRRRAG